MICKLHYYSNKTIIKPTESSDVSFLAVVQSTKT